MSKTQLKKEIASLTKGQLQQLVLEAYTARKEIKEYFDSFLNPDPQALADKFKEAVAKELDRRKRGGISKARISVIKKLIKDFASYQPGFQHEIDFQLFIVAYGMIVEQSLYFPEKLIENLTSFIESALELAERNEVLEDTVGVVTRMTSDADHGTRTYRRYIKSALEHFMSTIHLPKK